MGGRIDPTGREQREKRTYILYNLKTLNINVWGEKNSMVTGRGRGRKKITKNVVFQIKEESFQE